MAGENILVVDDDRTTASVMQLYLENYGFNIAGLATNGKTAIEKAKSLRPDLILMDINLGRGLDGIEAADVIIKTLDLPVIYISSHADDKTLKRAEKTNPDGFINKPLREIDLKTTVRFALERRNKNKAKPNAALENLTEKKANITDVIIHVYGLSKSEAKVVAEIINNPDIAHVAEALSISVPTVRTHLRNTYNKTKTKNLPALLHEIVTGPVNMIIQSQKTEAAN